VMCKVNLLLLQFDISSSEWFPAVMQLRELAPR
jgi:hypothetical protein